MRGRRQRRQCSNRSQEFDYPHYQQTLFASPGPSTSTANDAVGALTRCRKPQVDADPHSPDDDRRSSAENDRISNPVKTTHNREAHRPTVILSVAEICPNRTRSTVFRLLHYIFLFVALGQKVTVFTFGDGSGEAFATIIPEDAFSLQQLTAKGTTAQRVTVADAENRVLLRYADTRVQQIVRNDEFFAVALQNATIFVYRFDREATSNEQSSENSASSGAEAPPQLQEILQLNIGGATDSASTSTSAESSTELLEFKLTPQNHLLYCTEFFCRTCKIANNGKCANYPLDEINLVSLRASIVGDEQRLVVRAVDGGGNGSIYTLQADDATPIGRAADHLSVNEITVVLAFSTQRYTYFVGSAHKIDIPYALTSGEAMRHFRTDVRVSRVCNNDETPSLESRIDIALSCKGLDSGYFKSTPNRAKAASLSADGQRLFVVIENGSSSVAAADNHSTGASSHVHNVICEFNLDDVEMAFSNTWSMCQNIEDASKINTKCQDPSNSDDNRCFLFTWQKQWRYPLCERFNKGHSRTKISDNCEVSTMRVTANRNGWLENFRPLLGEIVAILQNDVRQVYGVRESSDQNAVFFAHLGAVERVRKNHTILPSTWTSRVGINKSPVYIEFDGVTNTLLYTDEDKIRFVHVMCRELYPTCDSIVKHDSLQCGWCAAVDGGGGFTFSTLNPNDACAAAGSRQQRMIGVCPPQISEVTFERGRYLIFGDGFQVVQDIKVHACKEECKISNVMSNLIKCSASAFCPIVLSGSVGTVHNFTLTYNNHMEENGGSSSQPSGYSYRYSSRTIKMFASIIVFIILVTILVVLWQLYRKYADRIKSKMQQSEKGANKYQFVSTNAPETPSDNSMALFFNNTNHHHHNRHHHHLHHNQQQQQLSGRHPLFFGGGGGGSLLLPNSTINSAKLHYGGSGGSVAGRFDLQSGAFGFGGACDGMAANGGAVTSPIITGCKGELDSSRITVLKLIGDGYSSKVHLGTFVDEETDQPRPVAIKTINNASFNFNDIVREIRLISECHHENIVQYVGHYQDIFGMHIVTEYMAGGDLHNYLVNKNNKPTVGDAFIYSIQICQGMEYLTKQHIIHRDLAARNCMLNEEHTFVKITDFGLCRVSNVDYEYVSNNNAQQLPFRWTAIECFGTDSKFSEKSEVWSFGVVLWEIFARDVQPYEGLDSRGVREYLESGKRLAHTPFCPDEIYERLMLRCWDGVPALRPTFAQLRMELEQIFWNMEKSYLQSEYEAPINSGGSLRSSNSSGSTQRT